MRTRLIQPVGHRKEAWLSWGQCPRRTGDYAQEHSGASVVLASGTDVDDDAPDLGALAFEVLARPCEHCGEKPPSSASRAGANRTLWSNGETRPQPGDVYLATWYPCAKGGACIEGWSNCDGKHYIATCPNGFEWDTSARASNCTRTEDTTHRCWCVHGPPEALTVDKVGNTCQAGGGSIIAGSYHGFLVAGEFRSC